MIGVDTNVLARLFVTDDPHQHAVARRFFERRPSATRVFVSVVVVVELVWLLDRTFDYPRVDILRVLTAILSSPDFVVERRELVESAVARAEATRADVADALIAGIAAAAGCTTTMTFDRDAAKLVSGMSLLK